MEKTKYPSAPVFVSGHSEKPTEEFRRTSILSHASLDLPDYGEKPREITFNYGCLDESDLLTIRSFNKEFDNEMQLKNDGNQITVLLKEIDIDKLRRFSDSLTGVTSKQILEDMLVSIKKTLLSFKQAANWGRRLHQQ